MTTFLNSWLIFDSEYQKRCSAKETVASQQQLKQISQQMENKSSQIKKLNSCLKKVALVFI